jgi:hypothetical protein
LAGDGAGFVQAGAEVALSVMLMPLQRRNRPRPSADRHSPLHAM